MEDIVSASRNSGAKTAVVILALAVSLFVLSMVLSGCTSQSSSASNQAGNQYLIGANKTNTTDTKTGFDKNQTTINAILADGTYSKDVSYNYHSGQDTVEISLTVQNDVVTAVSVKGLNTDPMSTRIIGNFNAALPDLVVGKKINELNLPHNVAGSSLTNAAFQQYVGQLIANKGNA